jgi:hypothetical protein
MADIQQQPKSTESRYRDKLKELLNLKSKRQQYYDVSEVPNPVTMPVPEPDYPNNQRGVDENDNEFQVQSDIHRDVIDPSLTAQPSYDEGGIQILNDIAADESLPVISFFISRLAQLGDKAQARLLVRAAASQSKNQVFSNIVDTRDYQMAIDDYKYAQILSKADFTAFDMNADYLMTEALIDSQHAIRLRRSRRALNLQMINTTRTEMAGGSDYQTEDHRKIWQKVPFLGGGGNR